MRFKIAESATAALDANSKIFRGNSIVVLNSSGNRTVSGRSSVFVGNVPVGEYLFIYIYALLLNFVLVLNYKKLFMQMLSVLQLRLLLSNSSRSNRVEL